jgi:hypothetical protein
MWVLFLSQAFDTFFFSEVLFGSGENVRETVVYGDFILFFSL